MLYIVFQAVSDASRKLIHGIYGIHDKYMYMDEDHTTSKNKLRAVKS